jgi:hypothetical protein
MKHDRMRAAVVAACSSGIILFATQSASAPPDGSPAAEHARVVSYWTPERRAAAIPRDLRIDERGLGYLRRPDGSLEPYGHSITAALSPASPQPMAKPGGDTTAPVISNLDPSQGATIGASYSFEATVTDASGLRSVNFKVGPAGGQQRSFAASAGPNGLYTVALTGFTDGNWTWSVVAKDTANNSATSPVTAFTVNISGGGSGGDVVPNDEYTDGGAIQNAAGRIYFEMPSNARRTRWSGFVCSGTVVSDATSGRSTIQTAAHCVYDDANKAFARNVLFIPNQAGTTGSGTDLNCGNDPLGCWMPSFGVVDVNWTTRTFPDNVAWDYAYYVVNNASGHSGNGGGSGLVLDSAVTTMSISFAVPKFEVANSSTDHTTALGYSYNVDPQFMYCAEDMEQFDQVNWWLGSCDLSGGSSGGPWMQPFNNGTGSLISVNSWGFTNSAGMAGPKLNGTSASCVFSLAKSTTFASVPTADGDEGAILSGNCP